MSSVEFGANPDLYFERFLHWRSQCLERRVFIESMDDSAIPEEFAEHVRHYRFGRALAIIEREGNPEAAGVAAVLDWLRTEYPEM